MELFDLSGFVQSMPTETVSFKRYDRSTFGTNGVALARTFATGSTPANVQPVRGADLRRLPEGFSAGEAVTIYCGVEFKMRDRVTLARGDYEVQHVEDWGTSGNFWKVIALRLQAGAES